MATNVLRTANAITPIAATVAVTDSLGAECKGAWTYRNSSGVYGSIAATQTALYKLASDGSWNEITRNGSDVITNGVFSVDANWTKSAGTTITAGVGRLTAVATATAALSQSVTVSTPVVYRVTFTISGYSAGAVQARFTGGSTVLGTSRNANGTYVEDVTTATGNTTFSFLTTGTTTLDIDNVTVVRLHDPYTGPDTDELWEADLFGSLIIITNINDVVQKFDIDTGTFATALGGNPPQAKHIETVGDFVFLSYTRESAITYPRKWRHSKLNDAENWTIDGLEGSSDEQNIPDGEEIQQIISCPGGARVIQRRAKRRLTFTPGSATAFVQSDIDATRGSVASYSIVNIGEDDYIYFTENGFYRGDAHVPIGQDQIDNTFLDDIDPDKVPFVQGANDPTLKIVWYRYQDGAGTYKLKGYDWGHNLWVVCDEPIQLLVSSVTVGLTVDDITDLVEAYTGVPVDSRVFKGGRITFGGFREDDIMYLFASSPMEATIETATTELNPEGGAFLFGTKVKGDVPTYTIAVGKAMLPDSALTWSGGATRSSRTGMVPHRADAKFHRMRMVIPAGTPWSKCHGITPFFKPSGGA